MKIILNGTLTELEAGATITGAVEATGASEPFEGIAVAINGDVVPRSEWDSTELFEGQRIEVVRAVQGG